MRTIGALLLLVWWMAGPLWASESFGVPGGFPDDEKPPPPPPGTVGNPPPRLPPLKYFDGAVNAVGKEQIEIVQQVWVKEANGTVPVSRTFVLTPQTLYEPPGFKPAARDEVRVIYDNKGGRPAVRKLIRIVRQAR